MKVSEVQMSDDPHQIVKRLVQEHGLDRALQQAIEGAIAAQEEGDNYDLSVWREVKLILRGQKSGPRINDKPG
jgi:hypothetical protein